MAVITCPKCGGKVSDKVSSCHHCGSAINESLTSDLTSGNVEQNTLSKKRCPECGELVSDKLNSCPHCGCPFEEASALNVDSHLFETHKFSELTCPNCGAPLSKGNISANGWTFCHSCNKDVMISSDDDLYSPERIKKIFVKKDSKDIFYCNCIKELCEYSCEDIFREMKNMEVKTIYVWVRKWQDKYFSLSEYGENFFPYLKSASERWSYNKNKAQTQTNVVSSDVFEHYYSDVYMMDFNGEYMRSQLDIVPRDISKQEYSHHSAKYPDMPESGEYFCVPIYECSFEYKGETYHFKGAGSGDIVTYLVPKRKKDHYSFCHYLIRRILQVSVLLFVVYEVVYAFINNRDGIFAALCVLIIIGAVGVGICFLLDHIGVYIDRLLSAKKEKKISKRMRCDAKEYLGVKLM